MVTPDGLWHTEHNTPDLLTSERVERVIFSGRTPYQKVEIQEGTFFGKSLILDDKTQSTEVDEFIYHETLVQPSMLAHPGPREVFIAGGGEGATAREALAHKSVERVTMVDIDREVVELCRQHLPHFSRGAFDDPRLELHFADALKYLEDTSDKYDVVIIDVPDPLEAGPAYLLYTREFYELLHDRLNPNGMIVTHAGPSGPVLHKQCFSVVARTIGSVFPSMHPYETFVPAFGGTWGFVLGSMGPDPAALSAEDVDTRIAKRVTHTLQHFDGVTQQGMFSTPKYLRQALADETRVITRDNPLYVS